MLCVRQLKAALAMLLLLLLLLLLLFLVLLPDMLICMQEAHLRVTKNFKGGDFKDETESICENF